MLYDAAKNFCYPTSGNGGAWCGLGAGEGGAGEKKLGYIIFPFLSYSGGKCN